MKSYGFSTSFYHNRNRIIPPSGQKAGLSSYPCPTSEAILNEDAKSLVKRFRDGIETLNKKGIDPILLQRAIITPICGTASLPIPLAERVCELTAEVSKRLRKK
jgi:hypothetical protein